MGFLRAAEDDRVEYLVVASARGRMTVNGGPASGSYPKARVFVLEDRTAVIVTPADDGGLDWRTVTVDTSTYFPPSRTLTVTTDDGETVTVIGQNCGCGMGAVGNAGPADGRYKLSPVRAPEWHTAV